MSSFFASVRRYFGGAVIKEGELDPTKTYVLGFHPHGIVPITVFWLRCCDDHWQVTGNGGVAHLERHPAMTSVHPNCTASAQTSTQDLFPGVNFSMLTASVMHLVPLMRDLMQYMGGREVSRESFRHALQVRGWSVWKRPSPVAPIHIDSTPTYAVVRFR